VSRAEQVSAKNISGLKSDKDVMFDLSCIEVLCFFDLFWNKHTKNQLIMHKPLTAEDGDRQK
jgi:hypothetical protein